MRMFFRSFDVTHHGMGEGHGRLLSPHRFAKASERFPDAGRQIGAEEQRANGVFDRRAQFLAALRVEKEDGEAEACDGRIMEEAEFPESAESPLQ
jgi:hypothetical protein